MTTINNEMKSFLIALDNKTLGAPHDCLDAEIGKAVLLKMNSIDVFKELAEELDQDGNVTDLYENIKEGDYHAYISFLFEHKDLVLGFAEKVAAETDYLSALTCIADGYEEHTYPNVSVDDIAKAIFLPQPELTEDDDDYSNAYYALSEWFTENAIVRVMEAYTAHIKGVNTDGFLSALENNELSTPYSYMTVELAETILDALSSNLVFKAAVMQLDTTGEITGVSDMFRNKPHGDIDFYEENRELALEFIYDIAAFKGEPSLIEFLIKIVDRTGDKGINLDHIARALYSKRPHAIASKYDEAYFAVASWVSCNSIARLCEAYNVYTKKNT